MRQWLETKVAGIRRHSVDILMVTFLLAAVLGLGVLIYLAAR